MSYPDLPTTAYETTDVSARPLPPPNRRRDKPQLSCTLCRKRKLKCDRGQPCATCIGRGLSLSCTYVQSSHALEQCEKNEPKPAVYLQLQEKIAQLEKLVISQIQIDDLTNGHDTEKATSTRTTYVECTHWSDVLDGINALKDSIEEDPKVNEGDAAPEKATIPDGAELLFRGCCNNIRKPEILAAIPGRQIMDQLISKCFNSVEITPVILHSPTFLDEYERFWENPEETPILWLGQLFAMMGLAILEQQPSTLNQRPHLQNAIDPQRQLQIYREKASQCLVVGGYTMGSHSTIITLLLYTHLEYLMKNIADTGLWVLLGIIIRLALRMGYHRDPSNHPQSSPFQSEMRRRVWAVILMMDATASAQFDLPRMIRASQCNVQEPRNLLDEDIWENMTRLPPARPDSIQTPVQFFTVKNKLISAASKVTDLSTLIQQPQYAEILRLDGILHNALDSIPEWLTMRSMAKSMMDSPGVIIQRIHVTLIYHRAKCLLHRPFILKAKKDKSYIYSRTACLESTLEILKIQQIVNKETKLGGRLHESRRKVYSFVEKEFFLATIILCADVSHSMSQEATLDSRTLKDRHELDENLLKALDGAYFIWAQSSGLSREAHEAAHAVRGVLERVRQLKLGNSVVVPMRASSTNSIEENGNLQNIEVANSPLSNETKTANARITASNPTFLPFIQASTSGINPNFSEMDFEMGNWWDSVDFPPSGPRKPDSDPRTFGWILPGGGNHDAF